MKTNSNNFLVFLIIALILLIGRELSTILSHGWINLVMLLLGGTLSDCIEIDADQTD